jgi:hypothetical protein
MRLPINLKSPNNTIKWQMGFNSAFEGLIHQLDVAIWLRYTAHYLQFFDLHPIMYGTCVTYRWIDPHPVDTFCLYLTDLSHNRPNTITKILSASRYQPVSYTCQRLTDPPLFYNTSEDTHILYMYAEVTHCGTVCYLLVTSTWASGTTFICINGEIRSISVSNVTFYVSDTDVTGNCLHVKWFKIYTSVSLRLNIQNINCLIFLLKINYRHIHAIELTDRTWENGSQRAKCVPF